MLKSSQYVECRSYAILKVIKTRNMVKIFMQVVIHMYCLLFQLKNGKIFSGTTSGLIQGIFSGCDSVAVLNHTDCGSLVVTSQEIKRAFIL